MPPRAIPADHQVGTFYSEPLHDEVWAFGRWAEPRGEPVKLLVKYKIKTYDGYFVPLKPSMFSGVQWFNHDGNTERGRQAIFYDVWNLQEEYED